MKTSPRWRTAHRMYRAMRRRLGHRHWWPGDTPFEVMVGAVLTQNTSWRNVERAIANLKAARRLTPRALKALPMPELERLIRPSGYFRVKARRLSAVVEWFVVRFGGSIARARSIPTPKLRDELLDVYGVGPETADSILLYAFGRPVFVVDAYTRRILYRHGMILGKATYEEVRALFERHLPKKVALYNDYHAQLVAVGHRWCRPKSPLCEACPLNVFPKRVSTR